MQPIRYFRNTGGWAFGLVIKRGYKWVKVLDISTLKTLKFRTADFKAIPLLGDVNADRTADLIERRIATLHRVRSILLEQVIFELRMKGFSSDDKTASPKAVLNHIPAHV